MKATIRNSWWLRTGALIAALGLPAACSTSLGESNLRKCHLVTNDKCQPGEMCVDPAAEHCVPADAKKLDEPCDKDEDCVATAVCGESNGKLACRTKCDFTNNKCGSGLECHKYSDQKTPDNLGYCAPPVCNPVFNTGCPTGEVCLSGYKPICGTSGTKTAGQACTKLSECGPKLTCANVANVGQVCSPLCDTEKKAPDNGCTTAQACVEIYDDDAEEYWPSAQGYCKNPCHPITDEGCGDKGACHGVSNSSKALCGAFGTVAIDDFCNKGSDCVKGATCVPLKNGKFKCKAKCDTTGKVGNKCPAGKSCFQLQDKETKEVLTNNLGACGP